MLESLKDTGFLQPKNFLPVLVVLVFSLTTLYSSVRLLDEEQSALSAYQGQSYALMGLEDTFHDFESNVFSYFSGRGSVTKQNLLSGLSTLEKTFETVNGSSHGRRGSASLYKTVMDIQDSFVYLDAILRNARTENGKVPDAALDRLEELHTLLNTYEAEQGQPLQSILTSEELKRRHDRIFWSVFLMGLSGFVLIIVLVDKVTNLRRANAEREQAMELLEERMQAIASAFDGICITDEHGALTYVNEAALKCYGYRHEDELIGGSWHMLYQREQYEWFEDEIVPLLMDQGSWHGHAVGLRRDGSTFFQDVTLTLLPEGGTIRVVRDVTDLIQTEALSKRRLAAIEAAGDGIGIVDSHGNLAYMNRALRQLHGISEDDEAKYIGKRWEQLYNKKGAAQIREEVLPRIEKEGYWRGESQIVRKNGDVIWAEMSLTRLPEGGFIGTARDISEKKKADRERAVFQEQIFMAQKMEAIGRLAGGIAHDFNNILAAIMGYAEFLEEDLEDDPKKRQMASNILQAGSQARYLVDQMLSFSRRKESEKEIVDLRLSVDEAMLMLKASLPKTVEIRTSIEAEHALIEANATQIGQVLMNLCVNAKDAMEDEHGILTIGVEDIEADEDLFDEMLADDLPAHDATPVMRFHDLEPGHTCLEVGSLARGKNYVALSVQDNGSGISRQVLERIFEPFFTTKAVDKGTGLGLANVHGIVADHRGALVVDTVIGKGTRFEIFFPAMDDESAELAPKAEKTSVHGGSGHILLVDDQEQVRDMMTTMLRRMGYEVEAVESALAALGKLRARGAHYDLVITDHNMPRMTGMELAAHAGLEFPDIPVILISGYSEQRMRETMEDSLVSVKAFLRKPVDKRQFSEVIHDVLEKQKKVA